MLRGSPIVRGTLLTAAATALGACQGGALSQPDFDRRSVPPSSLTLRVGETRQLHGVRFTFVGVAEDSRCATDVQCVWAGNARAEVTVGPAEGRGPTHHLLLNTGLEPREGVAWDLRVRLVALDPSPLSTRAIAPDDYVVGLEILGVEFASVGFSVTTDASQYAPGDAVKLQIVNRTDDIYWFNVCMDRLERLRGDAWITVESQRLCMALAQQLRPRDTARTAFTLEPDLPAGQYRLAVRLGNAVVVRSNAFQIGR